MPKGMTLWAIFHFLVITVDSKTVRAWPAFLKVTHLEQHVCCGQYRKEGDVFLSALSAVSLNRWIPSTKEAVCLRAPASLGVAGPWVRSMGLNGSQRGTVGRGAPSLRQPVAENRDRRKAPSSIAGPEFYLLLYILTPRFILCPHTNRPNKKRKKKKKSISICEWLSMPSVALTPVTLSACVIRGAERGRCLDLRVTDREEKVLSG